jgi:hypothetical protein
MNSKARAINRILRTNLPDSIKNYIVKRIQVLTNNKGCWIVNNDWSRYTSHKLHRKVFEAFGGVLISGRNICHKCDRPGCFNPEHLFQGTTKDNTQDAVNKGRRYQNTPASLIKFKGLSELRRLDKDKQIRLPASLLQIRCTDADWTRE